MKGLPFVLLFTAMTFCSWGTYGVTLHHGSMGFDHDSMRAFVGVGLAYFAIAVLIPVFWLNSKGESGKWTIVGSIYSFFAGAVGAFGALGIILALAYGGRPVYVMPLVFGFAPVVNTLMTAFLSRTFDQIRPIFLGGVVATALGAAGVLYFKPTPNSTADTTQSANLEFGLGQRSADPGMGRPDSIVDPTRITQVRLTSSASPQDSTSTDSGEASKSESEAASDSAVQNPDSESGTAASTASAAEKEAASSSEVPDSTSAAAEEEQAGGALAEETDTPMGESSPSVAASSEADASDEASSARVAETSLWGIVLSLVMAAACWGSYGPFLHVGQGKMEGSRLRPFACVGLAYFFIAVAIPLLIIYSRPEDLGAWKLGGMSWSFGAGVLGAIGALGVILAFNAGGKPYYVMPLIFGFAPVINTFISLTEAGTWSRVSIWFYLSLAVVISGAVTVLTNAPKPKPKPAAA